MTQRITALCAIAASLLCGAAGVWILCDVGLAFRDRVITAAAGLYMLGTAFAIGPALWSLQRLGGQPVCPLDRAQTPD